MVSEVLFSSNKEDWETPQDLFDELDREFGFNLDPASNDENAKCEYYLTPEEDGLREPWCVFRSGYTEPGRVFCNPPYGRGVAWWVEKGCREVESGNAEVVVMLLPARTDTRWFHEYIYGRADEIRFLRGRLKFGGAKNSAPFPSMVVVWRRREVDTGDLVEALADFVIEASNPVFDDERLSYVDCQISRATIKEAKRVLEGRGG